MVAVLHFVPDSDDPAGIVARYRSALAPGSYLVLSHATQEGEPGQADPHMELYAKIDTPMTMRSRAAVEAIIDGFEPVPPGVVFFTLAEETGAIVPLGRWVLEQACLQAARWWRAFGDKAPLVSVNISPSQLRTTALVDDVVEILQRTGLPAGRLQLELTEQAVMRAEPAALRALQALRAPYTVSRISERPDPTSPARPTTSPDRTVNETSANSPGRVRPSTSSTTSGRGSAPRGGNMYSIERPTVRAVVIGLPCPVDGNLGSPVRPPIMPGWHAYLVSAGCGPGSGAARSWRTTSTCARSARPGRCPWTRCRCCS